LIVWYHVLNGVYINIDHSRCSGIASPCCCKSAVSYTHTHTHTQTQTPLHFLIDAFSKKIKGLSFWHITSKNTA